MRYDHNKIETKWQDTWTKNKTFESDLKSAKKPFYNLMMFPYPSAEGLHVGNMYAFTGADVYGRFQRMSGYDVLEPIGLDGFGIHSENYAIKVGRHPKEHAEISEKNFYRQLHMIGNSYDWDKTLETYDPEYYKWTQWLFVKMYKKGLAYKDKAMVNWCPSCKTVLADEQVIEGKCERCGTEVTKREMSSWFFKITDYADRLLNNIEKIEWPEKIKIAQRNWIGKKGGINITYDVVGTSDQITVFTTAPVNFGATFIVVSPEHPFVKKIIDGNFEVDKEIVSKVKKYVEKSAQKSPEDRLSEGKDKTGEFTGLYAKNHVTNENMPIWVTDFVLMDVGTGAVQGCPAHDKRDFEFAKKFGISIKRVVVGKDDYNGPVEKIEQVVEHGMEGKFVNSDFLNGMDFEEGLQKTMDHFEEKGWGKRVTTYHLRDWLISRQRYWGPPIPMINCHECGWNPVPEKDLPVVLPDIKDFKPQGDGTSPLHNAPDSWKKVRCPECGKEAERELDVSDTFLDSSWYFLAYPNLGTKEWKGNESPLNKEITKKWLPVNAYIGGAEHAVLHLLYARFVTMVLKDLKYVDFEEPFPFLFGHGLIIKDGAKMSKSKGNVVNPDEYIAKFGTDVLRTYLMFLGPYDQGGDFRDTGIEGMKRFLGRVWNLFENPKKAKGEVLERVCFKAHQTIKRVTEDVSEFKYNTSIAAIMELTNEIGEKGADNRILKAVVQLLAPFAPHLMEELWSVNLKQKGSVHFSAWPKYNPEYLKTSHNVIIIQINGKFRSQIEVEVGIGDNKDKVVELAKKDSKISKYLGGQKVKKEIFVANKLVNFVI